MLLIMRIGTVSFIAGLLVGALALFIYNSRADLVSTACQSTYPLLSADLDCIGYDSNLQSIKQLDSDLDAKVAQYIKDGKATHVSVWVRDLISKQWASSNENDTYAPASLMKVPLMVAYYRFAQIQPSILDEPLTYVQAPQQGDSSQDIPSDSTLVIGQQYPVEQIIEDMIINSDNNATDMLTRKIDPEFLDQTLIDLGIKIPRNNKEYDFMTVKTYSNIYRMLYNASYLNRDYSEKALGLLSKEAFKGISESLPKDTQVAHKFGEREFDAATGTPVMRELHDCGIVYKDPHPYSICVMTQGSDFDQLDSIVDDISKTAYQAL